MTNEQAKNMLKAKLECLKHETSGMYSDCNQYNCYECSLCYEQGNMGEQKEALDMAIKALEQQYLNQTDQYNAGYNAAKREIALSGEYERAYERGKADAHSDINDGKLSEIPTGSERVDKE